MLKNICFLIFSCCVLLLLIGCSGPVEKQTEGEIISENIDTFPVFIIPVTDSIFINSVIQKQLVPIHLHGEIHEFYFKRNYHCAWFNENGLTEQAGEVVNLVTDYMASSILDTTMLLPGVIPLYRIVRDETFSPEQNDSLVLSADIIFTAQFLIFSKIAWKGLDSERIKKLDWFLPVKKISTVEFLSRVLDKSTSYISGTEPVYHQYFLLKEKLKLYSEIQKSGGWDSIGRLSDPLLPGTTSELLPAIRKRLRVTGDYTGAIDLALFDSAFADVIIKTRELFGLSAEAIIDNKLLSELNTPVEKRIRQMLLNLERWKWIPPDPGKNFILVNIPEFMLHVIENDSQVKSMKVIVGKAATQTVIFSGDLKYVVFSPYWNIPRSILAKETLPAIKKNHSYLSNHNMEVVTGDNPPKIIDPSQINWNKYSGSSFPYSIRQKPGANNSLGHVKFLFPNEFSIYLHDTPAKDLFAQTGRTFSHGCIRISEPAWLARYLLRNDTTWTIQKIDSAMQAGPEKTVVLRETLPVYITYFTSWVDDSGHLHFRKDVYNHDLKLEKNLFN